MPRRTVLIIVPIVFAVCLLLIFAGIVTAAELVKAKNGSGIVGYKDTPILPWCGYYQHDPDRPAPPRVIPKAGNGFSVAPPDAIILFNGKDMSKWKKSDWKLDLDNGELVAANGNLSTNESFGDCQLHIEWMAPDPPQGSFWDHGNNGVLLMGLFEIQIFDSYSTKIYPDGQAASVYGQTPPMVDACRKPGKWQSFDIIFFAPIFKNGKLNKPAHVTVFHNGVLAHHNQKIYGPTGHRILPQYTEPIAEKLPLSLYGHNNPVRFRNIWIRPL